MARRERKSPPARSSARRHFADLVALLDADLLAALVVNLEQRIDVDGWDQPWRLYGLLPGPDRSAIDEFATDVVRLDAPVPAEHRHRLTDVLQRSIALLPLIGNGDGHPVDGLDQYRAPTAAAGVVLVTEGWALPDDDLESTTAPSSHPRRVEVRVAQVLLRSGISAAVEHRRNGRVTTFPGTWQGRLPDTLARVLGIPVPPRTAGATVLARMTALAYLGGAKRTIEPGWALPAWATRDNWRERISPSDLRRWADVCMNDPMLSIVAELNDADLGQRLAAPLDTGPDWANPDVVAAVTAAFDATFIFAHARRGELGFDRGRAVWLGAGGCLDEFADRMPVTGATLARIGDHAPGAMQLTSWILGARHWQEAPHEPHGVVRRP